MTTNEDRLETDARGLTIEVKLHALDDARTRMIFRHTGWASEEMAQGAGGGWTQAFDKLASGFSPAA